MSTLCTEHNIEILCVFTFPYTSHNFSKCMYSTAQDLSYLNGHFLYCEFVLHADHADTS